MIPCRCAFLVQRVGDLDGVAQHLVGRQRPRRQPRGERLAFEILHHQEVGVTLLADVMERADVRMVQAGDRLRLTLEALSEIRIVGDMRREHLDGDGALEPRVGGLVDLAHAAGADEGRDVVAAESGANRERHF